MNAALRTELRKIGTTRTWWITAIAAFGYMVVMGAILAGSFVFANRQIESGAAPGGASLDPHDLALTVYTLAVSLGYIFPALLGALVVTTEFRHRTITPTLLAEPRRGVVLGAKLLAVLPFGLVVAVAGVAGSVVGGGAAIAAFGEPTYLGETEVIAAIGRSVLALVLWALVGVGFGSVLTNQVAAIVVLLGFTQFVEPLLRLALSAFDVTDEVAKFLPGAAGESLAGASLYSTAQVGGLTLLTPWQGALVLGAYALGLVAIGRFTTFRRDIG
jgi:ABC-2 type transport system permease protein